ncbi:MAG: AMP-binding protein [Rhizobiaceae bacterium]|nr:AMP-binding protein [Rhizobiaceae bacterium]
MDRISEAGTFFVHDIFLANARSAPDKVGLIWRDRSYTWRELGERLDALAAGLTARGIVRGSRVAVLDRNSDDLVLLHYALASLGAVLCPLNAWLRAPEIAAILANARPAYLVVGEEFVASAAAAVSGLEFRPVIVLRGGSLDGAMAWSAFSSGGAGLARSAPESWDDTHLILHTSGTTGMPKGVALSHRRTVADGLFAAPSFGVRRTDRYYCYTPLFHTGGWDWLKMFFMQQGSVVLVDRFDAGDAIRAIVEHRCTVVPCFPITLRGLIEHADFDGADMSAVRMIGYGGQDPSDILDIGLRRFRERGAAHVSVLLPYGMTECGPFITIAQGHEALKHPASVGTSVPGIEVALLDDDLSETPRGEIGEVCIRSPALMTGYIGNAEATEEVFAGGWLHTGDLARQNEDGFYTIVDRKKDMVRTGGENVFAKEVEEILVQHPSVKECAVVGQPDDVYGEMVVAVVVTADGFRDDAALKAHTRARLAGFKTPKRVVFVDELPHTPVGKIAKAELRKMLAAGTMA